LAGYVKSAADKYSCRKFNPPGDPVVFLADSTEAVYWREWRKAVSPKMTPAERKDMSKLLDKLLKDDDSFIFREAGECQV
jgi:transcription initiation factor TFIID subunit 2